MDAADHAAHASQAIPAPAENASKDALRTALARNAGMTDAADSAASALTEFSAQLKANADPTVRTANTLMHVLPLTLNRAILSDGVLQAMLR
jgi:DNA-binding phage protein